MKKILSFLLSIGVLTTTVFASNQLANTTWSLETYNGTGATGTVSFDETMMYSKFCNNVNQGYVFSGNALYNTGVGMSTMMYCEGLPMTLETNFVMSTTGSSAVVSGESLTITTQGNIYRFKRNILALQDLNQNCIQAYDECNNMCNREAGTSNRACTKMACSVKKDAQCIMSTNDIDLNQTVCTMEYNPVCGSKQVQCIKAPCPPIQQTYGNACSMKADGATLVHTGECKTDLIVGNDKDTHGCMVSAGYSWSQSKKECVRPWESQATDLEKAYDLAYNNGITTIDSLQKFRANDAITRQEAAKMFYQSAVSLFSKDAVDLSVVRLIPYKDDSMFDPSLRDFIYQTRILDIIKGSQDNFMPHNTLTRAQALAILMRGVRGMQDETTTPRRLNYVSLAYKGGYLTTSTLDNPEKAITRGELIQWIYNFSLKQSVK